MIPNWLQDWAQANEALLWWAGTLSVAVLVLTAVMAPLAVLWMPAGYFSRQGGRPPRFMDRSPKGRLLMAGRNLLGALLVAAGLVMLVTPGQGLLALAVGIGLMDIPGKHGLLHKVVCRERVLRALNRFRSRFDRPPLRVPGCVPHGDTPHRRSPGTPSPPRKEDP